MWASSRGARSGCGVGALVVVGACSSPAPLLPPQTGALRLSTHELAFPDVDVPLARVSSLREVSGLGGARRGLVTAGETALVVDPAHLEAVLAVTLPVALGRSLAHDELGERWAITHYLGLSVVSAEGEVDDFTLSAPASGLPYARHVARVGEQWWTLGSSLERVADDGTVTAADLVVPTFGCAAPRADGAWIALGAPSGGLDLFSVDSPSEPLGAPVALWSVVLPDRGCTFRELGDATFLCGQSAGWMAGPYETCALAADATTDAASFRLAPGAAGAWDGTGYVFVSGELGTAEEAWLARFVPTSGAVDRSAPPPIGHALHGVLAIDGRLWAISSRGSVLFLGEVTPELEVPAPTAIAVVASTDPWAAETVRWRTHPRLGLLGAWQSDRRIATRTGPHVVARRCGLLRVSLEGELAMRESPELCDGEVVTVGEDALVVAGGSIRGLQADLSLAASVSPAPSLPLLASGPSALFGEIACEELLGCSFSLASFDGAALRESTSPVVCPTTPRVIAAADAPWGFVVALRCEDTIRALVLDTRGADLGLFTLGTARWGGLGPIDDEDVEVHAVGARLVVTVQASLGSIHLFPFGDGLREEPLVVSGPSSAWPGLDVLYLPEARLAVDLGTRTVTRALWLADIGEHRGRRLPAGDGSVWVTGPPVERWQLRAPAGE